MTLTTTSPAFVGRLANSPVRRIALVAAGVGLITLGAKVQVPFWPVPMTLQTLALMFVFAASGLRLSLEIIFAYLAIGLAGLPVFAGAIAGPLYFAGPTAGFLIGFVAAAFIVGRAADSGIAQRPMALLGTMLVADVVIFTLGFLWLGFIFTTSGGDTLGTQVAFANGVKPFILADLVKITIAAALAFGFSRRSQNR
ncbi:MAG: biotin transporter BioY [Paracoccaceae bacterium]